MKLISKLDVKYLLPLTLACVAFSAYSIYRCTRGTEAPDPAGQDPESIMHYIASDAFSNLPKEAKSDFLRKMPPPEKAVELMADASKLPEEQRRKMHENMRPMFETMMQKKVDEYFLLSPEQREEYLDNEIARFEQMRPGGPGGLGGPPPGAPPPSGGPPPPGGANGRAEPPKPSLKGIKSMIESSDPATMAKMHQFHRDMRKRMEQRRKE